VWPFFFHGFALLERKRPVFSIAAGNAGPAHGRLFKQLVTPLYSGYFLYAAKLLQSRYVNALIDRIAEVDS
jgi:hypothetical protein